MGDEISRDTGRYCFMVEDTLKALELGAVEDLILWDNLDIQRFVLRDPKTETESIAHLSKEESTNPSNFVHPESGTELETVEQELLVEWMANHYKDYGCNLEFVTDRSSEGTQFVKGFGGIGGILRWKVDFVELNEFDNAGNDNNHDNQYS